MTTIRIQKNQNYTIVCNVVLDDQRLSWQAKGLAVYLLSKPNDWRIRIVHLEKVSRNGRDSVQTILKELIDHGYLVRKKYKNERGQFEWEQVLYETPRLNPDPDEETMSGNPISGFPVHGNSGHIVKTEKPITEDPILSKKQIAEEPNRRSSALPEQTPTGTMDFSRMKKEEPGRVEQVQSSQVDPTVQSIPVESVQKMREYFERDEKDHSLSGVGVYAEPYKKLKKKATTVQEIVEEDKGNDARVASLWANMGKQANSRYELAMKWARQHKSLAKAGESLIELSYLIYEQTGFTPEGVTFQNWTRQVNELWNACRDNQGILIRALQEGEKARKEGLSFSGPRSYVSFARNLVALNEKRKLEESRPVNGNVHTEGGSKRDRGSGLTGEYDKNGEEIIRIGSGRKR